MSLRKMYIFVKRDILEFISFRLSLVITFITMFGNILLWYFMAKLFGGAVTPHLKEYGGNYFAFVLIGIAFTRFFDIGLNIFPSKISSAQSNGSFEAMLATPTHPLAILCFLSIWSFIFAALQLLAYLLIGIFFFNVELVSCNYPLVLATLFLTILSVSAFGIIAAGMILIFKSPLQIPTIMSYTFQVFSGVYFPVNLLPSWIQNFSWLLPITYSLKIVRGSLVLGLPWQKILPDLYTLGLFTIILLPLSLLFFNYGVRIAKINGSLTS